MNFQDQDNPDPDQPPSDTPPADTPPAEDDGGICDNGVVDPLCDAVGGVIEDIASSGFAAVARAISEVADNLLTELMTAWLNIDTPVNSSAMSLLFTDVRPLTIAVAGIASIAVVVKWALARQSGGDEVAPVKGLITLMAVQGAGVTAIVTATTASDALGQQILESASSGDFDQRMMVALTATGTGGMFIFGLLIVLTAVIQIGMLYIRSALLVVMAAVWPLSAAAGMHPAGRPFFLRVTGWLVATITWKLFAAIVYAAAIRVIGESDTPTLAVVQGLVLMAMAAAALPIAIKMISPLAGQVPAGPSTAGVIGGAAIAGAAVASGGTSVAATGALASANRARKAS